MGPEEKEARSELLILRGALEEYRKDVGRYPTDSEQLSVLFMDPKAPGWKGPYLMSDSLVDPWQHPYVYGQFREIIFVASTGPNGRPETPEDHLQQGLSGGDDIILLMPNFDP